MKQFTLFLSTYVMLTLVSQNTNPVIPLADLKLYLRVNVDDDDDLIGAFGQAAQEAVEHDCNLTLQTSTWQQVLSGFHRNWKYDYSLKSRIHLLKRPLQSVTSITYYDTDNTQTTLDPSAYIVLKPTKTHGYIAPLIFGFPMTFMREDAVTVQYVAGYSVIPQRLLQAVKVWVWGEYWHEDTSEAYHRLTAPLNTAGYPA